MYFQVVHCIVEALSETPPLPANQSPLKKLLRVIGNQPQAKEALCRKIHRFVTLEVTMTTIWMLRWFLPQKSNVSFPSFLHLFCDIHCANDHLRICCSVRY